MKAFESPAREMALLEKEAEQRSFSVTPEFTSAAHALVTQYGSAPEVQQSIIHNVLDTIWERAPRVARALTVSAINDAREAGFTGFEKTLVCLWGHMMQQDQRTPAASKRAEINAVSKGQREIKAMNKSQEETALNVKAGEIYARIGLR